MTCKCGKSGHLCPVSFGLALGITSGLAILIWSLWIMYHGVPPTMAQHFPVPIITLSGTLIHILLGFVKGFIFGFVLVLIYDFFACYCKGICCRKSNGESGCTCCMPNNKSERKRIK